MRPARRESGTCRTWEWLQSWTWNTSGVGCGLLVVGCWKTESNCGTATRIGALLRVPRFLGHVDQLGENVGDPLAVKQPVAQDRVADESLVDGDRDRRGVFGNRHRRVFEQVPLIDPQAGRKLRVGGRKAPRLSRDEADRPPAKDALLVEAKDVLGERHPASEARFGDDAPRLNVDPLADADRREARALMRP